MEYKNEIYNWSGFVDLNFNPYDFVEKEIPVYHPLSSSYLDYWKEQKRRCIEGHWVGGRWMPGKLYFYVNFSTIKRNVKGSNVKYYERPLLRDLEWMFFYNWEEARGLSGFSEDLEYSSNRLLAEPNITDEELKRYCHVDNEFDEMRYQNLFKPSGKRKTYIPIRQYLRTTHVSNMGRPLYLNQAKNIMMLGTRGFGKDLEENTLIWSEDGERPIKDIKIGDKVFNHLGQLVEVTNKFKFTDQLQYKITLADGRKIECGAGHKWSVLERQYDGSYLKVIKELKDILVDYKIGKRGDSKYFLEYIHPLNYKEKDLPIDPYTLGALLGDGGLTQGVRFTTDDPEILSYFVLPKGNYINKLKSKYAYSIVSNLSYNPIKDILKNLGLFGKKSTEKFIPEIYLRGSSEQRIALLQGLLDTDGHITKQGQVEFSQSNKKLILQVKRLCESLGIRCSLKERKTKKLHSYRLNIITSNHVFRLKRKIERLNLNPSNYAISNRTKVAIRNIEPTEIKPSYCISVNGPDNLFIAGDCIPTHNSYSLGVGVVLHEWLFDGLTHYDPGRQKIPSAEILVGAADAKYSKDILDKTRSALERLPGSFETSKKVYPSPFSKQYTGSWAPARSVVATYKKKIGGNWEWKGTKSNIKHRTFKDNAFAAQGTRPGVMVFEEVGMFQNLLESYNASVECQRDGARKFGTMAFIGTGGDFEGGGTRDAYEMFYNPEKYDIITFEDVWENKPKIGYFVPAYMGLNDYKDEWGRTDIVNALKELQDKRNELKGHGGNQSALNNELQYRPIKPSEIFLSKTGNIFPIAELKDRLQVLESDTYSTLLEKKVALYFDSTQTYGVNYKIDIEDNLVPISTYPWNDNKRDGCVVIYEFPQVDNKGRIPKDMYIIGHDPYASDDPNGASFAATYVIKTKKYMGTTGGEHDVIVASYIGRPYQGREIVNENIMKLSMLYGNAKIYFENVRGNVKEYFEKMKRLDLLAKQPQTVLSKKASFISGPSHVYGYPMSSRMMKLEGLQYIRDWLLEIRNPEDLNSEEDKKIIRNLDRIWDKGLLQELIAFDLDGNFDRVMGFMGCIIGMNEVYNQYENKILEESQDRVDYSFLSADYQNKRDDLSLDRKNLHSLKLDFSKL